MFDGFHRKIDYIRLSVTDRCNLRCRYCMPPEGVAHRPMAEILTYEEIRRLCAIFASMGVSKLKITGGEPFVRRDICHLIEDLKQIPGIDKVTLTTNGILIPPHLKRLKAMGIDGINFSLDTLNPDRFYLISGSQNLSTVLAAVDEAIALGIPNIKINSVPMLGINDDELTEIAAMARQRPIHIRFIEMMPIGLGRRYKAVPEEEICRRLVTAYGPLKPVNGSFGNGPARYYHLDGFLGHIGFISAMSHRFCNSCNRVRLTSDGYLKTCLFYEDGTDLKSALRQGADNDEITALIARALLEKPEHHDVFCHPPESRGMSQIGG